MNNIELVEALNGLGLDFEAKIDIVYTLKKHDIEIDVCDNCLDFTAYAMDYGYQKYCSYDCMINDIDITEEENK